MESNEELPKKTLLKKKKKLRAVLINPHQLTPHTANLIGRLYESHHGVNAEETSHAEFIARGKYFRHVYTVTYINPNNNNQLIEQPIKLTDNIDVHPAFKLNPANFTFSHLEWLPSLYFFQSEQKHFSADQIYIARIPDFNDTHQLLLRPIIFTQPFNLLETVEINPSYLTPDTMPLLRNLLGQHSEQPFFDATDTLLGTPKKYYIPSHFLHDAGMVVYQPLTLTKSLVRFKRKKNEGKETYPNDKYRYAVYDRDQDSIGEGIEGTVYLSRTTLKFMHSPEARQTLISKSKNNEKFRLVKVLFHPRNDNGKLRRNSDGSLYDYRKQNDKATREAAFLKKFSIFSVKNPVTTDDNTRAALVMHYIDSPMLETHLTRDSGIYINDVLRAGTGKIFTDTQRIDISLLIGEAILAVHAENIIHRDISPYNILLKTDVFNAPLFSVVIDFGMAKWRDEKILEGCGTPDYRSPEVNLHKRSDEKSDAYAFAKILRMLWQWIYTEDCQMLSEHTNRILLVLLKGTASETSERATVKEIVSVFQEIKNERQAVSLESSHNNYLDPAL